MFLINKKMMIIDWLIFKNNSLMIKMILFNDWMSMIFISTIFIISSMVILYSIEYMSEDLNIKRFMLLIMIFVTSMILMIISPNMITILLGWDGLGLSSYCLVIYYQNMKSYNAGMITILMNRIGDICILLSIALFLKLSSWNFIIKFDKLNFLMGIMVIIASITKSAQIPFSSWLPLAMAAPTPISSLVHSSTLVTAGIYLLIRFSNLMSNDMFKLMMFISCFTMFFSGLSANFEFDLKKIIALSTLSQLGIMLFILSFNLKILSFYHLISHAMFKSLLFLCSGIMIHNSFNNQDIRFISFNNMYMPFINSVFIMSSLTLMGMPFLTGFYSKDFIIEMFNLMKNNIMLYIMMYLSMMFTVSYSMRLMLFISIKLKFMNNYFKIYPNNNMTNSTFILIFMALFYGAISNWMIFNSLNYIFLPILMKMLIFYLMLFSILLGILIYMMNFMNFNKKFMKMFMYFNMMFFLPLIIKKNKINLYKLNFNYIKIKDSGWLEFFIYKNLMSMMIKMNNKIVMDNINIFLLLMMMMFTMMIMLII
uniref:NADH-ubiquinone oxidoreductase chain 5 n=1 Tax=Mirax sp. QL-2014 TaxID=1491721 RepID=A0A0U1WYH7_9HYME|nr:NADH dehydrogenase subunit 5 [Mirax sp. QL-2014]